MKKRLLFGLLIITLLIQFIHPQDNTPLTDIDPATGLPYKVGEIKDIGDKIADKEGRDFLKKEYGDKLKENKYLGWTVNLYDKSAFIINPLSRGVFGMEPDLSWLFFLNLILSVTLVIYVLRTLEIFSLFSKTIQFIISIAVLIALSLMKVTIWTSEQIINIISKLPNWWTQLIGVGIVIIALVTASVFSRAFKDFFKALKEKQKKSAEELDREMLKQDVKIAHSFAKGISKGLNG